MEFRIIEAMNNKRILIGASVLSMLIYIGVLSFLLVKIYNQETEKFNFKYREIVDKSVEWMLANNKGDGFEKANYILDGVSQNFVDFINQNKIIDTAEFKETIYKQFTKILDSYQNVDSNLVGFLKVQNYNVPFKSTLIIRELKLIDFDQILPIKTVEDVFGIDTSAPSENAVLVYQYQFVGNHFNMRVDYYIDFTNKRKEVLSKVALSAALATISLFVVTLVFLLTLRNLLREKKLSQMKTDFINNMTHEFKTPLSTISIASRSLENQDILSNPGKVVETAKVISRQNAHLSKQINHLLEISKWERGQFELDRKRVDINDLVKGIVESFRWDNKDKSLEIIEEYAGEIAKTSIDETMITSAIFNILTNAVKYNQDNPTISIKVWADNDLCISIADNGIGIAKDEIVHIFDKFYRVSTGNIHNVKGLGLGLFYVKQIVEAHKGTISVTSKLGQGSIFTIKLPIDGKN
ncbi:MAG TPA: HAMP domain-containing sensor histidine kinase [Tenuifilaceae bacterium]|mgnify:FL=1|nr:HAMP domain-containing sensor histidine kinase [Tenuifilaceae bacterium]